MDGIYVEKLVFINFGLYGGYYKKYIGEEVDYGYLDVEFGEIFLN